MGLVNRVVPSAELETYVKSITDMICANAPLTIKAVKFTVGEILKDESKRDVARTARWWRSASPAATTTKAAPPSWKSASRCLPAPSAFDAAHSSYSSPADFTTLCPTWPVSSRRSSSLTETRPGSWA